MKLVSFEISTAVGPIRRIGALMDAGVVDLNSAYTLFLARNEGEAKVVERANVLVPPDMLDFLDGEDLGMAAARLALAFVKAQLLVEKDPRGYRGEALLHHLNSVKLLAPLPRPRSIRECSVFAKHLTRMFPDGKLPDAYFKMPIYWKGNPASVIGPDAPALWPSFEQQMMDYELEVACVIGRQGRNIPRESAMSHVAGFTIFNDVSARTMQRSEMTVCLGPSKGKDTCNILGPCIATVDEIADPYDLNAVVRINDKKVAEGNTKHMCFKWDAIIAHASLDETIYPGDVITSGTVQDTEMGTIDRPATEYLKPGDLIELELEGIGILRNRLLKDGKANGG